MAEPDASASEKSVKDIKEHAEDPVAIVVDMDTTRTIEAFIDQRVFLGQGENRQEVLI